MTTGSMTLKLLSTFFLLKLQTKCITAQKNLYVNYRTLGNTSVWRVFLDVEK